MITGMSILVLFLALGVASPKHISYYDNGDVDEPIVSRAQERRICAELCMAGLGGEPCGVECVDIIPQGLPKKPQSDVNHDSARKKNFTRASACPILCENRLGYPLCDCKISNEEVNCQQPFFKVDFVKICSHFCNAYDYQIFGCQKCTVYKQNRLMPLAMMKTKVNSDEIDWVAWCSKMCSQGEGGAACNCDLLPMSFVTKK